MSEELQSKYLKNGKIIGQRIGDFEYFQIGSTTFNQLIAAKTIPNILNREYNQHKPDRLIVDRRNTSSPVVVAVIEDKKNGKFNSENEKLKAIRQCNNYCQEIGSKIGIITDGSITTWINPQEDNKATEYKDPITGRKRSYGLIKKEDGSEIIRNFIVNEKQDLISVESMNDETRKLYKLIKEIAQKIDKKNSIIKEPERIDPLPLAIRVWQDIWVATGKSPEKCLYNVVELFIFKFLSDLGVLTGQFSFDHLYVLWDSSNNSDVLDYYAKVCRPKIRELFPESKEDKTTIINGTIFVNENGEANLGQANLFRNSVKKFKDFEKEYGRFTHIDKDFKTKLYESFLKQSAGLKSLGQYFTPRKVVQAIVRISGVDGLKQGARFCDPFCGVGGFVLEPINIYRIKDFEPKNGKINPPITYLGFDKGFERDEERTIILAKANMLLYLAETISQNPNLTKNFAEIFNSVFKLWKSNLGTLEKIYSKEEEKFDLILTNPPYVTSGSSTLKNEIAQNGELNNFYSVNASGIEGLALEWIIKSLKKGGKAFVIVPDGILNRQNDKKLRKFLLDECFLDGIISLPLNTFFTTNKKTYILAITKKADKEDKQSFPVFTYLVSDIGETLDINRFEISDNNLIEAVDLFNEFKGIKNSENAKKILEEQSQRCKIQSIQKFTLEIENHWQVDRWWSKEEKVELGIEEEIEIITEEEFIGKIEDTLSAIEHEIHDFKSVKKKLKNIQLQEFKVKDIFSTKKGKSKFTKKYGSEHKGIYPVFSASNNNFLTNIDTYDFDGEFLSWATNGFAGYMKIINKKFSINGDRGLLVPKKQNVNIYYVKEILEPILRNIAKGRKGEKGKDEFTKVYPSVVENTSIFMPVNEKGEFDIHTQALFVEDGDKIDKIQSTITLLKEIIENTNVDFSGDFDSKELLLSEVFDIKKGSAKYTLAYFRKNPGIYPVYSSQTVDEGIIGLINSFDFDKECITWTTDGIHAGTVFYRNGKFSMTTHCGGLFIKEKYKDSINLPYILFYLKNTLKNFAIGDSNKRVTGKKIKNVTIKIPTNTMGEFDLGKQKEIAQKHESINNLKKEVSEKLELLVNHQISFQ